MSGDDSQSFIVRVWRESKGPEDNDAALRGSIDHVSSGKRMYFRQVSMVVQFIESYMLGAPQRRSRWHNWLDRVQRKRE